MISQSWVGKETVRVTTCSDEADAEVEVKVEVEEEVVDEVDVEVELEVSDGAFAAALN